MDQPIYVLDLFVFGCSLEAKLNGFPVFRLDAPIELNFAPPINHALVEGTNSLMLVANPPISVDAPVPSLDGVVITGALKLYNKGDIVAPETGEIILPIDMKRIWPTASPWGFPWRWNIRSSRRESVSNLF